MKQFTTKEQNDKLVELGFPIPNSAQYYSIGELLSYLPLSIEPHDCAKRTIVGNRVLYCDDYIDWVELRFQNNEELIDNLFDACVSLKKEYELI